MKNLIDVFRAILVSFEFCILLGTILFFDQLTKLSELAFGHARFEGDYWKALIAIPLALVIYNFKSSKQILFPPEKQAELLGQWPDYFLLKNRVVIGIIYSLLSFGILTFGFTTQIWSASEKSVIAIGSVSIIAAVAWSFYSSEIKIREIFRETNTAPKIE